MTTSLNLDGSPDPRSFTSATDWIGGLQTLREQANLSVRDLARRTGASSSTIGGYVSGRHLPNLAGTALVERILLACGIEDETERQIWVDALHRVRRLPGPRPASSPAPFKGLEGYNVTDASWFYGREDLTCRVVDLAEQSPDSPIILVGASGCGKSSLLAAGATAAMIEKGWECSALTPGSEPTAAIERLVCEVAEHIAAGHRAVAVIDQLEELWTTDLTDPQRHSAIRQLADLAARTDMCDTRLQEPSGIVEGGSADVERLDPNECSIVRPYPQVRHGQPWGSELRGRSPRVLVPSGSYRQGEDRTGERE